MKFSRLKHQLIEPLCQCFIVLLCIIMEDQKQMFKDLHLAFFLIVVIDHKILRKNDLQNISRRLHMRFEWGHMKNNFSVFMNY